MQTTKVIFCLLIVMLNIKGYCLSDSLYVNELVKLAHRNTFLLVTVGSSRRIEQMTNTASIELYVYNKYYTKKYQSFYWFLLDVVNRKISIPLNQTKGIEFCELKRTEVSRKTKGNLNALIQNYLKPGRKGEWKLKRMLSDVQKNDLIRLMLRFKYIAYIQCDSGELVFWK